MGGPKQRSVLQSLSWTSANAWIGSSLQVILMIGLSRLIGPAEFGVVGVAMAIVTVVAVLSQFGFGQAVVRDPGDGIEAAQTALFLSLIFALFGLALMNLVAPFLAASLHGGDKSADLLLPLSAVVLTGPVQAISIGLLQRQQRFATITKIHICALSCQTLVAVSAALYGLGATAIVLGILVNHLVAALWSYMTVFFWPRFKAPRAVSLFRFSSKFIWIQLLDRAMLVADRIVLSSVATVAEVGLYQRVVAVRTLSGGLAAQPVDTLYFPRLSFAQSDKNLLFREFEGSVSIAMAFSISIAIGLHVAAFEWSPIVFGPAWSDVGALLQIMVIVLPFRSLDRVVGVLARATNKQSLRIALNTATLALTLLALFVLTPVSLETAVAGVTIVLIAMSLVSCLVASTILEIGYLRVVRLVAPSLLVGFAVMALALGVEQLLEKALPVWLSSLCAAAFGSISFFCFTVYRPEWLFSSHASSRIGEARRRVVARVPALRLMVQRDSKESMATR